MRQAKAKIISNEITAGVHLIWLDCPKIASEAKPGQFVMIKCGDGEKFQLRRPFSIHQVDKKGFALLFNIVGRGTQWLAQCQTEESLDILGTLGNGFSIAPSSKNLLLVAGGIGVAPLYYLVQEALKEKRSVTLLYGTADNKRLPIPPPLKLVSATEDGSVGKRGMITDILPDYIGWADQIFACGPLPMYKTMAKMPELRDKQVQVSLEVRMGCGLGVCYGCTIKTKNGLKQVCKDGPVFDLDDILWDELKD